METDCITNVVLEFEQGTRHTLEIHIELYVRELLSVKYLLI
jgi:hypothetical protein